MDSHNEKNLNTYAEGISRLKDILEDEMEEVCDEFKLPEKTKLNILTYSRFGYGKSSITDLPRPLDYMTVEAEKYLPMILKKLL